MALDPRTHSESTINRNLTRVFDGAYYRRSLKIENTNTASFLMCTNGKDIKFESLVKSNKGLDIQGFENCTTSSDGVSLTVFNMHRGSENSTTCELYASPTVLTTGVEFYNDHIPDTTHPLNAGGTVTEETAFILKKGTKYLYRITAVATCTFFVVGEYTEE